MSDSSVNAPGISLRTLIHIRWIAIAGQSLTILITYFLLNIPLPLALCFGLIALSVVVNLLATYKAGAAAFPPQRSIAAYLAFDTLQISGLVALTGGIENPFVILILAPVTVGATLLSSRYAAIIGLLALIAITTLEFISMPLAWPQEEYAFPALYKTGLWFALGFAVAFNGFYVWRASKEARKLQDAHKAVRAALAEQQKQTALGAQAAATAHALGSPLNTISLIVSDMVSEIKENDAHADDVLALLKQIKRCKQILDEFSSRPERGDDLDEGLTPAALLMLLSERYDREAPAIKTSIVPNQTTGPEPRFLKTPEIIYGVGNFIQNAMQFASDAVTLQYGWNEDRVHIVIQDDGPGFSRDVLKKIGEPYVSSRGGNGKNMGLGVFIAKTLLESTQAKVSFFNAENGGACVKIEWEQNELPYILNSSPTD